MKKASIVGRWGMNAALFFYWFSNTKNFCYGVTWQGNVGMSGSWTGIRSAKFLHSTCCLLQNCWISPCFLLCTDRNGAISTECLQFLSLYRSQQMLGFGVFQAPLGALVPNYFHKNLLQLLHTLPVSPSSSNPLCSVAAENLAPQRHLLFLQLLSTTLPIRSSSANYIVQWEARMVFGQHPTWWDTALWKQSWTKQQHKHISKIVLEIEKGTLPQNY